MTLEKKLVRLRKKEGMSQADVSEKLNVSRQAVSRWEAGDSRPSIENLQALCKLYTPASASMDFGLIDSDGTFYPVRANNGSINQTIRIDLRGNYTFAIRNNSSYTVNVFGFVNY